MGFRASMSSGSLLVHKTCQFMSPFFTKLIFLECHDSTGFCGCPTESACWIFCLQYCGLRFHIVQDGSSFPARFATLGEMIRHAATSAFSHFLWNVSPIMRRSLHRGRKCHFTR